MMSAVSWTGSDEGYGPWLRAQQALHRNIDTICDAWPHALNDVDAIGYGTGRTYDGTSRGGSELTGVEAAAEQLLERGSPAVAFIAELADVVVDLTRQSSHPDGHPWTPSNARRPLHDAVDELMGELPPERHWPAGPRGLLRRVERLASSAELWWPHQPLRKGQVVDGVTVGERGNQAELCHLCQIPVVSGRDSYGNPILKRDAHGNPYHSVPCYFQMWRSRGGNRKADPCTVDGCDRPQHAKNLCQAHYSRFHRTGVIGGQVGIG
jgi:hypothetical protein